MNGLLLNEHRLFNECAKEYAAQHLQRDYQAMKTSVKSFMQVGTARHSLGTSSLFLDLVAKEERSDSQEARTVLSLSDANSLEFLRCDQSGDLRESFVSAPSGSLPSSPRLSQDFSLSLSSGNHSLAQHPGETRAEVAEMQ